MYKTFEEYKEKDLSKQINGVSDPMAKEFHIVEAFCKTTWDAAEENYKQQQGKLIAKIDQLKNMLEDVVNVLDLSEIAIEKHGPIGTPPAKLVELVIDENKRVIRNLQSGLNPIKCTRYDKWYTWQEQLPPFDVELAWYSEKHDRYGIGKWSYPQCSNHKSLLEDLRTGKSKVHGVCIDSATHWKHLGKPDKI